MKWYSEPMPTLPVTVPVDVVDIISRCLAKEPAAEIKPQGGITPGKSLAGRAYVFKHVGAYDDIDSVYEAITAWLDEKGLTSKGAFLEEYLNEPEGSDDAKLELNIYVFVQ